MPEYTGRRLAGDSGTDVVELIRRYDTAAGRPDADPVIRSFAYVTGPAYGFAYDRIRDGWRADLRAGLDLGEVGVPASAQADVVAATYGADAVVEQERARDRRRSRVRADDEAAYLRGPTLRLPMSPSGVTFNPQSVRGYAFGTVYADVSARWDDATLTAGEALVAPDWRSVLVSMPLSALPRAGVHGRCTHGNAEFVYGPGWRFERDGAGVVAVPAESA